MGFAVNLDRRYTAASRMKRIWCKIVGHRRVFTKNFDEPPDYDAPCGMHYGSSHYSGECSRCFDRDLFRGPYRPDPG